jgi:diguanylate cyclase
VQQDFLTQLGCDSLQGYLLGHPLPAQRFMKEIVRGEQIAKATRHAKTADGGYS